MANRYWIGGTGNWSDTSHWSASSGGSGGASAPTSDDDVFIDKNSGFGGGGTLNTNITIKVKTFNVTTTDVFTIDGFRSFGVIDGFVLKENVTMNASKMTFYGGDIDFGGATIGAVNGIAFIDDGTGNGDCKLLSDIDENIYSSKYYSGAQIAVGDYRNGFLDVNDHNIKAHTLYIDKGECYMGSGTIECWGFRHGDGATLHCGTSTLKILSAYDDYEEGYSYFYADSWSSEEPTFYNVLVTGEDVNNNLSVFGSFTCNEFKIDTPTKKITFVGADTLTVNSFAATGSAGNFITLDSTESGGLVTSFEINNGGSGYAVDDWFFLNGGKEYSEAWFYVTEVDGSGAVIGLEIADSGVGYVTGNNVSTTTDGGVGVGLTLDIVASEIALTHNLVKTSGVVECDYLDLSNSNATGGATWYAGNNSVDGGGNEGWIFPSAIILVNSGEVIFTNPSVSVTGKATIDLNVNEIVVFNPSVSVIGKATIDLNVNEVIFTSPSVDATGETVVTVSASEVVFDTKRADVIGEAIANVNTNEIVFFNPIIDVIGEAIIDVSANETNLTPLRVNITEGEGISFDTSTDQAIFTNLAIKAVEQGGGYSPLASILNLISPEITVETEYNWYFPNKANSKWKKLEAVQTEWTKNSKIKTNWKKI